MADLSGESRTYDTGVIASTAVLPEPPSMWSYSSLKEVETCPRRFALSRADYPELWNQRGYPRTPNPAAIKGDVVHGSLEVILKAMVKSRCPSTRSATAVAVLRELGGYTAVAEDVMVRQLSRFDGNPRVDGDRRENLARVLSDWIPEAREQIQTYLNHMDLTVASAIPEPPSSKESGSLPARRPAVQGDHPEQELVAERLRLNGRLDLLTVGPASVSIVDFKTGAEDPSHYDQLRLYALLWDADSVVNPEGLPVSSLTAAYPRHEVRIAVPDGHQLAQLASDLGERVARADARVAADVPPATVGDHCGVCNVRALCDTYWTTETPEVAEVADGTWFDLQGTVAREHGVKSYVVREAGSGRDVLVRTPSPSSALPIGHDVRILGARRIIDPDEEDALIVSLNSASETFQLTSR